MAAKRGRGRAGDVDRDHEDFYHRIREKVTAWADRKEIKPVYRDYLLALPDLFYLVARLVLDGRVDATTKALLGVALAYTLSPFDLLPDFLGPLGFVDDLLVIALALESALLRVPRQVVEQHWAGKVDLVGLVKDVREAADQWVGRGMYLKIRNYLAERGLVPPAPAAAKASRAAGRTVRKATGTARAAAGAARKAATKAGRTVRRKAVSATRAAKKTTAPARRTVRKTVRKATRKSR